MADIMCPICETPNEPDASHCVVCGERLTPAAEGEELAPEENVSGMVEPADQAEQAEEDDRDEQAALAEESDVAELQAFDDELGEAPAALYSPVDGNAYPQGSPEYEDGFGPMGEELVAQLPEPGVEGTSPEEGSFELEDEADDGYDDDGYDDVQGEVGEEISHAAEQAEEQAEEQPAEKAGPSERFQQAFEAKRKERPGAAPLPTPGVLAESATLTLYQNRQPALTHPIDTDETLIGRRDPVSDTYPDLDVEPYDAGSHISRKHAYVYRQNRNYTLYVVSNAGTQLNSELLNLGDRRKLSDGDVIVLAGAIALKFELPQDQQTVVPAHAGGESAQAPGEPEPGEELEVEPLSVELEELDVLEEIEVAPASAGANADELEPLADDYLADDELE